MDFHGDLVSGPSGSGSLLGGDVYRQDDNYTRSAVSSAIPEISSGGFLEKIGDEHIATAARASHVWFEEGKTAPPLPTDPLFRLEATTVFIGDGCDSAAGIGNSLLAYFEAEATAIIMKVSPVKFALKAKVECQGFQCELKVRVYTQETGHSVEFQRRDGDAFVFGRIYERAASQLIRIWAPQDTPFLGQEITDTELVIFPPLHFF